MDFKQASEIRYNIQPVEPFVMPMVYTKAITQQGNNGVIAQGTYKGLNYYVKNIEGMHPTAYIELSQKFRLYNDAYELEKYEGKVSIECHGGVTYVSQTLRGVDNDGERNHRFVGWDYGHCTDFSGYYIGSERFSEKKKWTTEEIIEECKEVIEQILNLEGNK